MSGATITKAKVPSHVPADRVIDFDLSLDPALKFDPFKRIAEVRGQSPKVCYTTGNGGHWIAFGRDDIHLVLSDAEHFSSAHLGGGQGAGFIPLSLDPPEHGPWRLLLLKYVGPAQIRAMEPFVRSWAERLTAKLEGQTSCDFLKAVAEPMPVSVFMVMMGLPLERFDEFRGLVLSALTPAEPGEDMTERMGVYGKIMDILNALIESRRREPKDDLVSKLVTEEIYGRPVTHEELMSIGFLLFLAGLDTVTNAMTYGMRHLAMNPDLQDELRRDRGKIPSVIERMLRLYTFVNTNRLVKKDVALDGVTLKAGELIWLPLWGGSNEPGGETEGVRHMAFGSGPHQCLGVYLARLELKVMYETWFDRIGAFSLAPDPGPSMRGGSVMSITRLLLNLEPLRAAA
jgi:cytochrome P450